MSPDGSDREEPATSDEEGAGQEGTGVFLAIGLADLPLLPNAEAAIAEQKFMFEGFEEFVDPAQSLASQAEAVQAVLAKFGERDTFEEAPIEALRALGLAALRPAGLESLTRWQPDPSDTTPLGRLLRDLHSVRTLVWARVEAWRELAEGSGELEKRQQAVERLRCFADELIPSTRGKRGGAAPPARDVYLMYRQLLSRLNRARELLEELGVAADRRITPKVASEVTAMSGLPEPFLKSWLFFEDRWERRGNPYTAEQMARQLVADLCEIEPESVANILSRGRRRAKPPGEASS